MVEATIEDLAITIRPSRESGRVRWRGCIEHDFAKGFKIRTSTGAKPFLKADIKPLGITEMEMLPGRRKRPDKRERTGAG